jgi:hypothetical protein
MIFIHLCKSFLGIPAHFNLCRALYHLRAYPKKGMPDVVGGAVFLLRQRVKYLEANLKDSSKKWAEEWFMVANPTPGLSPRTGYPPVLNDKWEEMLSDPGLRNCVHNVVHTGIGDRTCPIPYLCCTLLACKV